eukprot:COSAG06_NODE_70641_length_191_cov_17.282609_1_plen_51_part_10
MIQMSEMNSGAHSTAAAGDGAPPPAAPHGPGARYALEKRRRWVAEVLNGRK